MCACIEECSSLTPDITAQATFFAETRTADIDICRRQGGHRYAFEVPGANNHRLTCGLIGWPIRRADGDTCYVTTPTVFRDARPCSAQYFRSGDWQFVTAEPANGTAVHSSRAG